MEKKTALKILSLLEKGGVPCIDSRLAGPGDVFFALRGENFDGNDFAHQAIVNGCTLAVVDRFVKPTDDRIVRVDNVLTSLQQLAHYYRSGFDIPFIGITGSNGKTTTKELMHKVLSAGFKSAATAGNLNNHIGVPLTLLSTNRGTGISIVEMGANHQGEIARLCEISMPTHGLITNIGKAHLEGFGSVETIRKSKGELFGYIMKNRGVIFVNRNDSMVTSLAKDYPDAISYGSDPNCHCTGRIISSFPFLEIGYETGMDFGKAARGTAGSLKTQLTGSYNFENVLAAVTVGLYFGIKPGEIKRGIESYTPSNNRSQLVKTGRNNHVILDAYNANPTSMDAAIENFSNYGTENTAVMLGDMLELGESALREHQKVISDLTGRGFEKSILVGSHFGEAAHSMDLTGKKILLFEDVQSAASYLESNPLNGYRILLKGSRGIGMEKLLKYI